MFLILFIFLILETLKTFSLIGGHKNILKLQGKPKLSE